MASSSTSHEVSTSGAEDTTGLRACVLVPSREGWERISNRILATNEPEQVVAGYLLPTGLPDGSTQQQGFLQTFTKDQVELLAFHKLDQFLTPYYPEIPRTGAHVFAGMGLMNVFADGTNPNKVGMVVRAAELLKDWEPLVDLYLKSRIGRLCSIRLLVIINT